MLVRSANLKKNRIEREGLKIHSTYMYNKCAALGKILAIRHDPYRRQ